MSKRFIDTNLFNDDWFMDLSKDGKLFFVYFITNCDHAGILKLNKKLIEFQTKIKDLEIVIQELGKSLIRVRDNVFFMPKYINFQYPDFPKSNVKQQESALRILIEHGMYDQKTNSIVTVSKELNNSYDNDIDNVIVIDSVIKEVNVEFSEFWDLYPASRKTNKSYCKEYWEKKLTDTERQSIIEKLNLYISSTEEKFLKTTEYFFKHKKYSDEAFTNLRHQKSKLAF
jgi:hypothetical protein